MNDGAARFAARLARVWHVIVAGSAGPWLQSMGLLPATDLNRLAGKAESHAKRNDFRGLNLLHGLLIAG
ncbi:MAG TPA: hypothetical protein VMQ99_22490 [Acetobacteraceae bacterium]|nr:hypothetical protein [Acetobacteraceae bacterium]